MYPPVDTTFYTPVDTRPEATLEPTRTPTRESHFLIVSALVPYKRLELAIDACARVGAPLHVVGDGPDRERLERLGGPAVTFLGKVTDAEVRDEYRRAQAVLLPGEEDFGIVPVEAQACGTPVVALGRGGALETVIDGETGVLFSDLTGPSLAAALERLAASRFDAERLRRHAERFSRSRYLEEMRAVIDETVAAPAGTRW